MQMITTNPSLCCCLCCSGCCKSPSSEVRKSKLHPGYSRVSAFVFSYKEFPGKYNQGTFRYDERLAGTTVRRLTLPVVYSFFRDEQPTVSPSLIAPLALPCYISFLVARSHELVTSMPMQSISFFLDRHSRPPPSNSSN